MSLRERIASLLHYPRPKPTHNDEDWFTTSKRLHDLLDLETVKQQQTQFRQPCPKDKSAEIPAEPAQTGGSSTVPSQVSSKEESPRDTTRPHEAIDDTECLNQALREYRESSWDDADFKDLLPEVQHAILRRAQEIKNSATRLHVASVTERRLWASDSRMSPTTVTDLDTQRPSLNAGR